MSSHELQHNILYICTSGQKRGTEEIVADHVLSCIMTGYLHIYQHGDNRCYGPGTISLLRKNLLLKTAKETAADGTLFQSLNIFLDNATLKKYSAQYNLMADGPYNGTPAIDMSHDSFIKGYFESLLPYFKSGAPLTANMANMKTFEAIELVLRHNSRLKNMLFDYSEPFKIDLEAFMAQHYIYNIPISQFARLSGRSLATFKRDFKKHFNDTPERWIKEKRLERAHFLIKEQKQTPASVFIEVGFENLSHFSTTFKKRFGYTPSMVHHQ